jgi:hypothetical protein
MWALVMPVVIRLGDILMDSLNRLTAMGFIECGEWVAAEDQLLSKLLKCADAQNILYAFVVDDVVMYIGKTVQSLRARMQGYRTPGQTQLTNVRNNQNLRNALGAAWQSMYFPITGSCITVGFM